MDDPLPEMDTETENQKISPADPKGPACPACHDGIVVGQIREVMVCLNCGREFDWKRV